MLETILEMAAILLVMWVFIMNYSWFTRSRKDGDAWHWTVFLGPNAYFNHLRDERNEEIRVRDRIIDAAADDWRKRYIWR